MCFCWVRGAVCEQRLYFRPWWLMDLVIGLLYYLSVVWFFLPVVQCGVHILHVHIGVKLLRGCNCECCIVVDNVVCVCVPIEMLLSGHGGLRRCISQWENTRTYRELRFLQSRSLLSFKFPLFWLFQPRWWCVFVELEMHFASRALFYALMTMELHSR